jgi:hypothetical protein
MLPSLGPFLPAAIGAPFGVTGVGDGNLARTKSLKVLCPSPPGFPFQRPGFVLASSDKSRDAAGEQAISAETSDREREGGGNTSTAGGACIRIPYCTSTGYSKKERTGKLPLRRGLLQTRLLLGLVAGGRS